MSANPPLVQSPAADVADGDAPDGQPAGHPARSGASVAVRSRRDRMRGAGQRLVSRGGHLWPLLFLAGWTTAVWAWPVLRGFAHLRLSNPGDSESFAWYLSWNVHALTNGMNPFFTPNLYAPDGMDLGNAISVPSVSILVAPVTVLFGGTAGFNTAFLLAIFFGGAAVYLLARELFGSALGASLAGALVVVSPYFTGHALGHLNMMWVFGLPLLAYLVARWVRGRLRRRWFVVSVASTVAFTIGASTELFVTQSVFAVVAFIVAVAFATTAVRGRLTAALPWLALGGLGGVALGAPVIVAALRAGIPETIANPPALYATDLTNVVAPTYLNLIGDSFFAVLRSRWLGNDAENTAYLPITLLVLVLAVLIVCRERMVAGITAFAVVTFVFSLGPYLTIAGAQTVPMPWTFAGHVPGLDHALTSRFSVFVFMALALLVARGWASGALPRWFVGAAVALTCVLLLPNLRVMPFPVDASVPEYVSSGALSEEVAEGENVLVLPAGQWGPGMRWMDELDFEFEMPTGNGGGAEPPDALLTPVGQALFYQRMDFDFEDELLPYLQETDVELVVVDGGHPQWKAIMDEVLPGAAEAEGGVWVYDVP